MISKKSRDELDELLYEFKDEFGRIEVDMNFCIRTLESMIKLFKEELKGKDWYEANGIAIIKKEK